MLARTAATSARAVPESRLSLSLISKLISLTESRDKFDRQGGARVVAVSPEIEQTGVRREETCHVGCFCLSQFTAVKLQLLLDSLRVRTQVRNRNVLQVMTWRLTLP